MRPSEFVSLMSSQAGIVDLIPLSDDILNSIRGFEFSAPANGFLPVDPAGFREVISCPGKYVLLFNGELPYSDDHIVELIDDSGNIVGHDVDLSSKHLFDSPDYIWISDDLFFDMKKIEGRRMTCVIRSVRLMLDFLPEGLEARLFFPCTSSTEYLEEVLGFDISETSVALMGVTGFDCEGVVSNRC